MKEIITNPTFEIIEEAFHLESTIFLCPEVQSRELEYYSTIFKQFAPRGSVCFLSSGSTGNPKIHAHSWENLMKRAMAQSKELGLDDSSHYLSPLPLNHLSGFMPILRCMVSGSKITVKKKAEDLLELLQRLKPTHVSLVPTQLNSLVKDKVRLDFLDTLLLGGAGCSEEILKQAKDLKYPVRACYGMTESASFFSIGKSEEFLKDGSIKLYLMENWNAFAQPSGRLTIESDEMYLGSIGPLGFIESNGILPTFDLGEVNHPIIKIIGRSDLVFKSGGEKVDPLEVEKKLEVLEAFNSVVIVPKKDDKWGNITCAFIEPFKKGRDYTYLVDHLPSHQKPRHFFPLEKVEGIKPKRSELALKLERIFAGTKKLPRVAFLHGFMGSENDLKVLASGLENDCYPVFWKLPFHQDQSDHGSLEIIVNYFVEKVRKENIVAIYGYSMGGRLATAIAYKLESIGEPLSALILESSHPGLKSNEEKEKRYLKDKTLFDRMPSEPQKFFDTWYGQDLFGDFKNTEYGKISIKEMRRRWNPESWKKSLKILSTGLQPNYRNFLLNSRHPILYLYGERDKKYANFASELKNKDSKQLFFKCLKNGYHNLHSNNQMDLKTPISELLSTLN